MEEVRSKVSGPILALDDLLLISRGRHLAFLKAYFDESESHAMSPLRFLSLGGCTMQHESWKLLAGEWSDVLRAFGVTVYRSSALNASRGEYAGWTGPQKDEYRGALSEVITASWRGNMMSICPVYSWVIFDLNAFDEGAKRRPDVNLTAYELAVLMIVGGCRNAIANISGENTLGIFFEAGRDVRFHVRSYLNRQKESDARIVDTSFVEKDYHIPLQVADMVAYEVLKSYHDGKRKLLIDLINDGAGHGIYMDKAMIDDFFDKANGELF